MTTALDLKKLNQSGNHAISDVGVAAWHRFLQAEIDATLKVFRMKPKLLLGHVRSERQTASDYAGRELLELVQNAADAATEAKGAGRVRIEIDLNGLVVANTGQPFRTSGVESLMTPNASDKPGRKAALIGAKGLGFRSLLNWSQEPIVSSGALEIRFSRAHAAEIVAGLAEVNDEIAAICESEDEPPVPVLAFPAFGEALEQFGGSAEKNLVKRVRELRELGYDTVVAAPFDDERGFERAKKQAGEFEPTFLLFVGSLEEIELRVGDGPVVRWRRTSLGNDTFGIEANVGGEVTGQTWICMRRRGEITVRGKHKPRVYDLAIALRTDATNAAGHLHSYFPTSIPLPFPALMHATLELDSNRKAIKEDSDINDAVLTALASFYVDVLAGLVKAKRLRNPLDFLARDAEFPPPLKAFETAVYRMAQPLPLILTMRGDRVSADVGKIGPSGYETFLPSRLFGDLIKSRGPEDRAVLERLGVAELPADAFLRTLRRGELTVEERANAIVGIAQNLGAKHHHRWLLLDQKGRPMADANTPFPPPSAGDRLPQLPDWAKAKFIDPALWRLVMLKLEGPSPRDRLKKLIGFRISEYSNESIIASLRAQAASTLRRGRRDADEVQRSLLSAIYSLYDPVNRPPPGVFRLRACDGEWRDSRELHLSGTLGQSGTINTELFRTAPQYLLASTEENGIDGDVDLSGFFEWIGVNRWPRAVVMDAPEDLLPTVLDVLPPTIEVHDDTSHQSFSKSEARWGYSLNCKVSWIVGLDGILDTAQSDAILAWLAMDQRFDSASPNRFSTTLTGRKDGKANFRTYRGALPDLVRERVASRPWLACKGDSYHAPRDTMVQPGRLTELFSIPRPAAVGSEEAFGLSQAMWRRGLEHAQVPQGLVDLTEARIFKLLDGLRDRSAAEETVRRLYQQVLELERFDPDAAPTERAHFLASGAIQVHRGRTREWVAPADALYADHAGFPLAVREFLPLIDLPPRRNTGNVADRFGVPALSQQRYSLELTSLDEDVGPAAVILKADLKLARPYIRALRLADSNVSTRLRRFERLELKIARSASIAVTIGDRRIEGPVEPWTHVLEGDKLIVAIEGHHPPAQITMLAHEAIADGIAEVFELQSGADFSRLLGAQSDDLRAILLRRMLPNLSDAEIADLLSDIGVIDDTYEPVKVDAATLARGPAKPGESLPAQDAHAGVPGTGQGVMTTSTTSPPATSKPVSPTSVTATALSRGITSQTGQPGNSRVISVRVARATGPVNATAHPDPFRASDAEEWTGLFEVSQGRFPLSVGHLQGRDTFGCDWLSFSTVEDLETFRSDPARSDLVTRYIETKAGTVEFTDNETRAAQIRGDRYFVYRVEFYGSRGMADLTIVANPLSHRHALLTRIELRVDAVEGRERFQLTPERLKDEKYSL